MIPAEDKSIQPARWQESRWLGLADLAVVLGIFVADLLHLVPFSKTPFLLLVGWISLRLRGIGWRGVGFVRPRSWLRTIAIGTVAGIALELFADFVTEPWLAGLAGKHPDLTGFRSLVGNPKLLLVYLTLNWTLAAFGEEMVYRGYLMNRVADLQGGTQRAWILSLFVVSALFGYGHEYQGLIGVIQEGLSGLLLGLLYLGSNRTLGVPIIAHGVSNTLAFLLIFLGRYPGV
jgi:membrane protease YdiL (CAAX protease family)